MCGINGKVNPRGVTEQEIRAMNDCLAHRGPDDEGVFVDGMIGLGQRRLSIIDLAGGHQPMTINNGELWALLNGEIYNYQDIRERLNGRHTFSTKSDTEVILHLYEEMGEACVNELRGMFAFAIWDTKERKLFIARDHLGQKPMFYTHKGDELTFASEIKALLTNDPSLREMNCEALHQYLTLRIIAPPRTMYSGVHKLPPAHTLTFKDGKVTIKRYWTLTYEPKLQLKENEIIDQLEEQMLESVRYHMVSDVPVGAFLSGGMDSSTIVAMMTKLSDEPIKTFSVGVPYENHSELPFANLVAEKFKTQHFTDEIFPSLVRVLPELVYHLDEPSDPLSACMFYISEMASREVKVVLGGDGGDELFGGYDRYFGNRYMRYYALMPKPVRQHLMTRIINKVPDGFWYKSLSQKLKWVNELSFVDGNSRYARSLGHFYFTEKFRKELYGDRLINAVDHYDPEQAISYYFSASNAKDIVDKMLFADSMIRLPDHPVMILDRTTMAHGLEARAPFMDHKLAEFAAKIPASLKVHGKTLRYVQQKVAERYLPPEIMNRKKQGFNSPLPYLLADEYKHLFEIFLFDSHLVRDGYLNDQPIKKLLGEHLNRKVDHGNRLWLLCNSEIWYRMAIEGSSIGEMKERIGEGSVSPALATA